MADVEAAEDRFTVTYDEATVRRAVRTFMWRRLFATAWFAGVAVLILALAAAGLSSRSALLLWSAGFLLALTSSLVLLVWRAHLGGGLGRLRAMSPPAVEVIVSPGRLAFRSSLGEAALPWSSFTEVWRTPTFWLLFTAPGSFNVLPVAGVEAAVLDRLSARLPPSR